jgi:hypothetical protein
MRDKTSEHGRRDEPGRTGRRISALCVAAFLLGCSLWLFLGLRGGTVGWDFRAFYVAGRVPIASLYNQPLFIEYGKATLGRLGIDYYPPYVRPAVFAVPLRVLSWLPFWHAFALWYVFQLCIFALSLRLLYRWLRIPIELLPAFGLFAPAAYGPVFGQDPNTIAFVLIASLILLLKKKDSAAGLLLALTTYKFHTVLLLPLLLALRKRYPDIGMDVRRQPCSCARISSTCLATLIRSALAHDGSIHHGCWR